MAFDAATASEGETRPMKIDVRAASVGGQRAARRNKKQEVAPKSITSHFAPLRVAECDMQAALNRGADELMNLCEFWLEPRPLALAEARRLYGNCCRYLFLLLEEHYGRAGK
jgi:hypothetical protein